MSGTDEALRAALSQDRIAVIGCSSTPGKAAHEVPRYARRRGYDVVPVNPFSDEILGRRAYDSLADVDPDVDVVNVFRPSEEVPEIVDAVLERREARGDVSVLWLQLGIRDDEAAARADDAGLTVIQDRCFKVEHRRLRG